MRHGKKLLQLVGICLILWTAAPLSAHANLVRSEPSASAALDAAPEIIRIWFTEPLEPDYSRITLLDASGSPVELPPSEVDTADPKLLSVVVPALPDGLYTVSWRVVSSADGHPTEGSFAFGINVAVSAAPVTLTINETVPADGVIVRWINLLSLAVLIGGLGFALFVWQPAAVDEATAADRLLRRLMLGGWVAAGVASLLMLLLQAAIALDGTLFGVLSNPQFASFTMTSTYGRLWLARTGLWVILGGVLFYGGRYRLQWALILGIGVLLTQSMFSHASAAPDAAVAIAADWLHLLATSLWIGGLFAFVLVLIVHRPREAARTGQIAGYFSNYVRVAVAALVVTGIYATWLQVGSIEALVNTVYGQALLVKIVLFLPLLLIALVNLVLTQRQLQAGQSAWVGRLRGLVGAEIALTAGILVAVAVMTSGAPARGIQAQRAANAAMEAVAPADAGYFGMEVINNQMIHLEITPGYVGENTFIVTPFDVAGASITDASLIRLRFDNLDQNLGQSELRPVYDDGRRAYIVTGANLSTPGHWRIRMTIQRPGEFDTVADFEAEIHSAPPPPQPVVNDIIPRLNRVAAAGLTGIALLVVGGFFLLQARPYRLIGTGGFASLCVLIGGAFLLSATLTFTGSDTLVVENAWARPAGSGMTAAVYLTLENHTAQDEALVTAEAAVAEAVEIHESVIDNDISRMLRLDRLPIPAGERVSIDPGGYHLMLVNLNQDLREGDQFPISLRFESGSEIILDVTVQFDP